MHLQTAEWRWKRGGRNFSHPASPSTSWHPPPSVPSSPTPPSLLNYSGPLLQHAWLSFHFCKLPFGKRGALLNHIATTSYKTVYLPLCREERGSERKQRRHKWLHYTLIIPLCRVVIFMCCKPLSVNTANSPTVTPHKHLSAQVQITRRETRRGAEETWLDVKRVWGLSTRLLLSSLIYCTYMVMYSDCTNSQ